MTLIIENMQEKFLSTASSYSDKTIWTQKKLSPTLGFPSQFERDPGHHDLHRKYSQFMGNQNIIIAEVLLSNKSNDSTPARSQIQEEVVNRLRDSSNQFIKNLLQELAEAYSKLRTIKSSSDEKIKQLQLELVQLKTTSKLMANQFYSEWSQNSQKCQKYLQFVQEQLTETVKQYQVKISQFLQEIQRKQQQCDRLYCQKLQLGNQINQLNRVLRMERQDANQKCKQFKGMDILIGEYQSAISQFQTQGNENRKKIHQLQKQVDQLKESSKDLTIRLDQSEAKVDERNQEIGKLNRILQDLRSINDQYQQQLANQRQKSSQETRVAENNIVLLKNNQKSLKLQIQQILSKLANSQIQVSEYRLKLAQFNTEMKKSKLEAKATINKVQLMFKAKQNLLKKCFKSKLNQLRAQKQKMKEQISKQVFRFYQQLRIDLITSNIPESKSSMFQSKLVRI